MKYVIGVDVGTQSTKGILMNAEGRILTSASRGYSVETPKPLWAQQWPEVWLEATMAVLADIVRQSGVDKSQIASVCISSLYGGSGIAVDENLIPLYPCLIWMDRRASDRVEWVKNYVDTKELFRITGNSLDSYYGYTKILWIKEHEPEVWENTRFFLPPNSYINYKLTGEVAVDHCSAGNIGGVYNIEKRDWSTKACRMLGIPKSMMPSRLVASEEIVGGLLPEMAEKLGLAAGTPIVAGGVDAAVATLAAGVVAPGNHVAMIGTSMCWGFINHSVDARHGLISMPHVNNPLQDIYTFGGAITAGASVTWFIEQFCSAEKQQAKEQGCTVHHVLEEKAKCLSPGADGLVFLPYLMGERSPIWDAKATGTLVGLSLYHTRHHMYRAVLEGITFALKDNIESGKACAERLDNELIVVGGAAFSDMWMQIIADVTGYPVLTIKEEVEAPLGDCFLAAKAVGIIQNAEQIKQWFTLEARAEPDAKAHEKYNALFNTYRSIYKNIKGDMHQLYDLTKME
jgi:sugar (pentulose or hexulose) kinase